MRTRRSFWWLWWKYNFRSAVQETAEFWCVSALIAQHNSYKVGKSHKLPRWFKLASRIESWASRKSNKRL